MDKILNLLTFDIFVDVFFVYDFIAILDLTDNLKFYVFFRILQQKIIIAIKIAKFCLFLIN